MMNTVRERLITIDDQCDRIHPPEDQRQAMVQNTAVLQEAMDSLSKQGGGQLVIPAGHYFVRMLKIPSYVDLNLSPNARLVAWPYTEDYRCFERKNREHQHGYNSNVFEGYSLIVSQESEYASLSGQGCIDGNAFAFWDEPVRTIRAAGRSLEGLTLASNLEEDSPFWRERTKRVSPLVEFDHCHKVRITDVRIESSPGWTLHPFCCKEVLIEKITIENHLYGPNTDGIDINGCEDVSIRGCRISCGDDAIIIKSSGDASSSQRITISDCILSTHCAAIGIGAEVTYPIRDIAVSTCVVERALRMVQIELWEPGLVENVSISTLTGMTMTDIPLERPIYIDIQHHGRADGLLGSVRNVRIHGLQAVTRGRCLFTAAEGSWIENLIVSDVQLIIPEIEDPQVSVPSSRSNQMSNSCPETRALRGAFVLDHVCRATIRDVQIIWPDEHEKSRAGELYGSFDRGELTKDIRKQESLKKEVPMHAFILHECQAVHIDAPQADGYTAERIRQF